MAAEQSQYYRATFQPAEFADITYGLQLSGRYPEIAVKVERPGTTVQARAAVYIAAEEPPPQLQFDEITTVEAATVSPFDSGAIGMRATPLFGYAAGQGLYIDAAVHIDARGLTFTKTGNGPYRTIVAVTSVVFDSQGVAAGDNTQVLTYAIPEEKYSAALKDGLLYSQRVPSGGQVRISFARPSATTLQAESAPRASTSRFRTSRGAAWHFRVCASVLRTSRR